jgi:lipopolysaccharide/colanic/teichoic acid biosynthesis glycosyltransferase
VTILGSLSNAARIADQHRITDFIVAPDALSYAQVLALTGATRRAVAVHLVPGTMEVIVGKASVDQLQDLPLVEIRYNITRPLHRSAKRVADVIGSSLLLTLVSPMFHIRQWFAGLPVPSFFEGLEDVLRGEKSLVGPPATEQTLKFKEQLGVDLGKPGLTGLAQLQSQLTPDEEEQFVLFYARNQSFVLDLEILLKTWFHRSHVDRDTEKAPWQK